MSATQTTTVVRTEAVANNDGTITVWPIWSGIDNERGTGYQCPNKKVAVRLARAMVAGVVFTNPTVGTNIHGKTYVSSRDAVNARKISADLTRLGF